mmetsp:Transcript_44954/g.50400  ORF Transcript_44954/g.50400 Transcript_44954/m.50400 type:complete len:475 (-) Transcript_44954:145-1569(-)
MIMKFWIAYLLNLAVAVVGVLNQEVTLLFRNESDEYISIHWVNPKTQATALIKGDIKPNLTFTFNSYLTHQFEVWQLPDPDSGLCGGEEKVNGQSCKINYFQVTESPDQGFIIKKGIEIETVKPTNDKTNLLLDDIDLRIVEDPMHILTQCKERATKLFQNIDGDEKMMQKINDELHDCITVGLAPQIKASKDEVDFERTLRLEASNIAENFTCVNVGLESSPDVATEEWTSSQDNVTRTVHKKLDRPASRIHVVENFASLSECEAMEIEAEKDLHIASTADGKGGTKISLGRKAMQAGISPLFTAEGDPLDGNLIATLSGRVYEYVNHVLDMNISHHGQEPLMSIQYSGRGKHDIEPDRYTPHCDGRCTGENHVYGGRMATTVIYCTIPDKGGSTNFQNSNVHVKANAGSAVFFSYIDPTTNETDNGLTQHSGCPVYEGEKKIITQWVRYGVDTATPHSAFNTLTVLRSEDGE